MQHYYHPIPSSYGAYGADVVDTLREHGSPVGLPASTFEGRPAPPSPPPPTNMLKKYRDSPMGTLKMLTTPIAMGVGYYRTKSIWKALLLGFVSTPYLIYVAYDTYKEK